MTTNPAASTATAAMVPAGEPPGEVVPSLLLSAVAVGVLPVPVPMITVSASAARLSASKVAAAVDTAVHAAVVLVVRVTMAAGVVGVVGVVGVLAVAVAFVGTMVVVAAVGVVDVVVGLFLHVPAVDDDAPTKYSPALLQVVWSLHDGSLCSVDD